jgi:hypothetical protein
MPMVVKCVQVQQLGSLQPEHERVMRPVFYFDPIARSAAAVRTIPAFGHQAFPVHLAGYAE